IYFRQYFKNLNIIKQKFFMIDGGSRSRRAMLVSYLIRKTWLVAKSYGGSLCFSHTINQKNLILSYSVKKDSLHI
ncbi:hypothetical protein KM917_09230, partial [Virgibacillus pantothenticus]|uniref:hypothetical protein n=1 Tax=Virgibacillus pantothenticus TaxID=1473 RepID=UPI001C21F7C0